MREIGKFLFVAFLIGCALYALANQFNVTPVIQAVQP